LVTVLPFSSTLLVTVEARSPLADGTTVVVVAEVEPGTAIGAGVRIGGGAGG